MPYGSRIQEMIKVAAVDSRFIQVNDPAEPLVVKIFVRGRNPSRTAEETFHLFGHGYDDVTFEWVPFGSRMIFQFGWIFGWQPCSVMCSIPCAHGQIPPALFPRFDGQPRTLGLLDPRLSTEPLRRRLARFGGTPSDAIPVDGMSRQAWLLLKSSTGGNFF